jgi:hypothetical protein
VKLISHYRALFVVLVLVVTAFTSLSGCTANATSADQPKPVSNRAPIISQLLADIQVNLGGKSEITCIAVDPDGDPVKYTWSTDKGRISGEDNKITWTAPDTAGVCTVKVIVSDDKGLQTEQSINILVAAAPAQKPNLPPVISQYLFLRKGFPTVTVTSTTVKISMKRWSNAELECVASDPEGGPLKYVWGCTEGKIDGDGPKVQYIATTPEKNIAITVTVIDDKNAKATATVYIEVPCCGSQ